MSSTSKALLATIVFALLSQVGCSFGEIYLEDPFLREVALNEQQKHYTSLIRWSAFHKAARYVQPERRDEFIASVRQEAGV